MKRKQILCAVLGSVLVFGISAWAQEQGLWRATSSTAQSITGDVIISNEKLTINFSAFIIAKIRSLSQKEVSAVFDTDSSIGGNGSLYRLDIPASKKFLHKNTLCGSDDTQWMVTYVEGRSLRIAFFSGAKPPVFTLDAISNSTNLCGVFTYGR